MKGRLVVLDHRPSRAALIVDGRLEDLLLDDGADRAPLPGEIHAVRVTRAVPNVKAAFADIGGGRQGYLRDAKGLTEGQMLLAQVAAVAEPGKATPLDRRLLIKGRRLILTRGTPGVNISRRIREAAERDRLTAAIVSPAEDVGIIVRTSARDAPAPSLVAELEILTRRLEALTPDRPGLAGEFFTPESHAIREWCDPVPDRLIGPADLVERLEGPDSASLFFGNDDLRSRLYSEPGDPFDHHGVWEEIERLKSARTDLPSGGWMAIEATRAMVTVDVNTGGEFGGGAALSANIEAARALPRQLRLRGLGGQITVDFAPLKKMHRKQIEEALRKSFRADPIETTLAGWTPLGNFELQRKRERRPLSDIAGL